MVESDDMGTGGKINPIDEMALRRLREAVDPGPVLILPHHDPDPDALSGGSGLAYLLESGWGLEVHTVYSGIVARAENVAMLHHLTPSWHPIRSWNDAPQHRAVILVDTQPGAGNNILPEENLPVAVFDHHQPIRPLAEQVPYLDLRPHIGATATLAYQHLEASGLALPAQLATALFYGIKTDTRGLSRGASAGDEEAYVKLLRSVDHNVLLQVEYAHRPAVFFQSLIEGLAQTRVYGTAVVAAMGDMHRSDFAAELADLLVTLEGVRGVLCVGRFKETLHLSIRTGPLGEDAGLLVQQVIHGLGTGGGHGVMAGGQVGLNGREPAVLADTLAARFLKVMGENATPPAKLVQLSLSPS